MGRQFQGRETVEVRGDEEIYRAELLGDLCSKDAKQGSPVDQARLCIQMRSILATVGRSDKFSTHFVQPTWARLESVTLSFMCKMPSHQNVSGKQAQDPHFLILYIMFYLVRLIIT